MAITEISQTLALLNGAVGLAPGPAAIAAMNKFWNRRPARNLMRAVHRKVQDGYPGPVATHINNGLYLLLLNEDVAAALERFVDGHVEELSPIRAALEAELDVPAEVDRAEVVDLVCGAMRDNLGRAQTTPAAAVDVGLRAQTTEINQTTNAGISDVLAEIQQLRADVITPTQQPLVLDVDDYATWARKATRALKEEPAELAWLMEQLGDRPDSSRARALLELWPSELEHGSDLLVQAVIRHAEAVGAWDAASMGWERLAGRAEGPARADRLVRAAVNAGVANRHERRQELLATARAVDPRSPRLALEALDEARPPDEQLAVLTPLETDDRPLAALIQCQIALLYLRVPDMQASHAAYHRAVELDPDSYAVKLTAVNLPIQEARLALRQRARYSTENLTKAREEALKLRAELLAMRRFGESVRLLMLAAETHGLCADRMSMIDLLEGATREERLEPDGPEVLADAALRAGADDLALEFCVGATPSPGLRRIEATAALGLPSEDHDAAVAVLDDLLTNDEEGALAALARLTACLPPVLAPWSSSAADLLKATGHENVAVGLRVTALLAQGLPVKATIELEQAPTTMWADELRLRVMGYRRRIRGLIDAANTYLAHGPGPTGQLLAARGLAQAGDVSHAQLVAVDLANDLSAPSVVRADAFDLLVRLCLRKAQPEGAQQALDDWQSLRLPRPDPRIDAWRPTVGNRLSRSQA